MGMDTRDSIQPEGNEGHEDDGETIGAGPMGQRHYAVTDTQQRGGAHGKTKSKHVHLFHVQLVRGIKKPSC